MNESEWNLISVGKVLGGLALTVAGIIMAAIILGYTVPYGPFLMFTCIVLTVLCAVVVIIRMQQCRKEPRNQPGPQEKT
jgi:uncharacterized protein (DUF58 family)